MDETQRHDAVYSSGTTSLHPAPETDLLFRGRAGGCRGHSSGRPNAKSSAWLRGSTMRPCSTTRIWSARRMVERVGDDEGRASLHQFDSGRPGSMASDSESSELVASSRIRCRARPAGRERWTASGAARRELYAALAHDGVIGFRVALGKLVHACPCDRRRETAPRSRRAVKRGYSRGWCHRRETSPATPRPTASERCSVHVRKVHIVHNHATLRRSVEGAEQADDGGLART